MPSLASALSGRLNIGTDAMIMDAAARQADVLPIGRLEWDGSDHQTRGFDSQVGADGNPVRGLAVHALAMAMFERYRRSGRFADPPPLDADDLLRK